MSNNKLAAWVDSKDVKQQGGECCDIPLLKMLATKCVQPKHHSGEYCDIPLLEDALRRIVYNQSFSKVLVSFDDAERLGVLSANVVTQAAARQKNGRIEC